MWDSIPKNLRNLAKGWKVALHDPQRGSARFFLVHFARIWRKTLSDPIKKKKKSDLSLFCRVCEAKTLQQNTSEVHVCNLDSHSIWSTRPFIARRPAKTWILEAATSLFRDLNFLCEEKQQKYLLCWGHITPPAPPHHHHCHYHHHPAPSSSLLCPPSRYYWAFCNSCFHGNMNQVILWTEGGRETEGRERGARKLAGKSLSVQEVRGVHTSLSTSVKSLLWKGNGAGIRDTQSLCVQGNNVGGIDFFHNNKSINTLRWLLTWCSLCFYWEEPKL